MKFNKIILCSILPVVLLIGCEKKCPDIEVLPAVPVVQPVQTSIIPIPPEDITIDSWNIITTPYSSNFHRLDFPTQNTGFICGTSGTILKTTDQGISYIKLISNTTEDLYTIDFVNENTGYIGGNGNTLLKTSDGGLTWNNLSVNSNIRSIYFFNENIGFIGGASGYLRKTIDGGQTWSVINSGTSVSDLHCIHFINSNIGFISGIWGYLAKTIDGGQNWVEINTGTTFIGTSFFWDISFVNENTGYICGGNMQSTDSYIIKTNDGGLTWTRLLSPINDISFVSIRFLDENIGYTTGRYIPNNNNGNILKTIDGGISWASVYSNINGLHGLCLINSGKGFASGYNTTIVKGD